MNRRVGFRGLVSGFSLTVPRLQPCYTCSVIKFTVLIELAPVLKSYFILVKLMSRFIFKLEIFWVRTCCKKLTEMENVSYEAIQRNIP